MITERNKIENGLLKSSTNEDFVLAFTVNENITSYTHECYLTDRAGVIKATATLQKVYSTPNTAVTATIALATMAALEQGVYILYFRETRTTKNILFWGEVEHITGFTEP